ncbi:MAG: bifunctional primase/polymerase [Rhizobiaceae bacterium]|jgi:hypothetical protein|nr:bifunctional primase/polymerase [Rhizobiaceae bacterium]
MIDIDEVFKLFDRGVICVPVRSGSKYPDYEAMGLTFDKVVRGDRALSRLAFDSLAFCLSQHPPGREQLGRWFREHQGNVGIVAGFNGLVVLDLDNAYYYDRVVDQISRISKTFPVERTPHGYHLYLRCSRPHPCSSLYLGGRRIGHFSALGGFVTCSPSVLADGSSYSWMPGRSLLDCDPVEIECVNQVKLALMHPLRRLYRLARPHRRSR